MVSARLLLCSALAIGVPSPTMAQSVTLADVLDRAGRYVADFHRRISAVVAEEQYVQDSRTPPPSKLVLPTIEHRRLQSDVLLVNVAGTSLWVQFRDVFEVDGEAVRDRSDRLANLFIHPTNESAAQVEAILAESARYNVGPIQRTVNTPILPLAFLEAVNRTHFRFYRSTDRVPAAGRIEVPPGSSLAQPFGVAPDAWVIRYEEKTRPTFIRTDKNQNLPSHGRFWIDPATGRVLMSEVIAEDRTVRGTITVSYHLEPSLDMLLPVAMRERYEGRKSKVLVDASATYGHFRQFQVSVDATFAPLRRPSSR